MKIKMRKTENQASAEFKYLENNQLYGNILVVVNHLTTADISYDYIVTCYHGNTLV